MAEMLTVAVRQNRERAASCRVDAVLIVEQTSSKTHFILVDAIAQWLKSIEPGLRRVFLASV
jgi:gamma-glutamyl:cysteine ligase YbdK (ATP-grasp superfamily)